MVAWGCGIANFGQCSVPSGLSDVTAIAAGFYHGLALESDGTVVVWGCVDGSDNGQCGVPSGLSDVTAVTASYGHSLALKNDGTVVAWGCGSALGDFGQCSVPSGLSDVTAVAAGLHHSLALVVPSSTPPDTVKPTVTISRPVDAAVYPLDKVVTAAFKCVDKESGLASCVGTQSSGANPLISGVTNLDTSTLGSHTITVTGD